MGLGLACGSRAIDVCPSAHAAGTKQGFFCIPAVGPKIPLTLGMTAFINEKLIPRAALDVMTTG
jgi:hypothetical protein